MTPGKLAELAHLQHGERFDLLNETGVTRLEQLRRELAMAPEVADNPATLFTDESSRPNLDGSNYNDTLHRMTCDELESFAKRVGRVAFEAAVPVVLAALKK
jgi:hypothetical protein